MKRKIITFIVIAITILLCFADNLFSQSFIGFYAGNKGLNLQGGAIVSNIEIKGSYQQGIKPYANIGTVQVGYQILVTDYEQDNYSVTPSIGYGYFKVKDFSQYDKTGSIINKEGGRPVYGIEVGLDKFLGRYFISGNYCNGLYFGIGIKAFFRYNKLLNL